MPDELGVIRMICPNLKCRALMTTPASSRGKSVRCMGCGIKVGVPARPLDAGAGSAAAPRAVPPATTT